jgi:short-subunit dehydrogenase
VSENVLIVGATSGIAQALCRVMAGRGCRLLLAARDADELGKLAADLQIRTRVEVMTEPFEALDFDQHPGFILRCIDRFNGDLTGVVVCHGHLAPQADTQADFAQARRTIDINFTSVASVLNAAAAYFQGKKGGYLAAISSVAGDRGRKSNYTYGAAKAGLSAYLAGLRNRLHSSGVHVLSIKPGFVDTAMTRGSLKPSPLVASPERVARDIDRAIRRRKDVLYTPWFWRPVMWIIRTLPEWIFKRLSL